MSPSYYNGGGTSSLQFRHYGEITIRLLWYAWIKKGGKIRSFIYIPYINLRKDILPPSKKNNAM
jgi:hypothetical protein